jgi:hypothetical protein
LNRSINLLPTNRFSLFIEVLLLGRSADRVE